MPRIAAGASVGNAFPHSVSGCVRIDVAGARLRIAHTVDGTAPGLKWQSPQPFSKGEGSRGFGLGLGIVRRLCERYGVDLRIATSDSRVTASIRVNCE